MEEKNKHHYEYHGSPGRESARKENSLAGSNLIATFNVCCITIAIVILLYDLNTCLKTLTIINVGVNQGHKLLHLFFTKF